MPNSSIPLKRMMRFYKITWIFGFAWFATAAGFAHTGLPALFLLIALVTLILTFVYHYKVAAIHKDRTYATINTTLAVILTPLFLVGFALWPILLNAQINSKK